MLKMFKQLSLLIMTMLATHVLAAEKAVIDGRKVAVESYKWAGESPKSKIVRVINPYGSVTSRTSKLSEVELSGVIQKIGDNPPQHTIEVKDNHGVTEVVVSYPQGTIRDEKGQLTGRVDLGVWIPSWIILQVETDYGDIKIKKSASNIVAKSNTGKISIGSSGHIEASSESGNITVDFYGERFKQPMKVVSRSGNVKVNLSQHAEVLLSAKAGTIKNNFSDYKAVSVKQHGKELQARLTSDSNNEPVNVRLSAEQGSLSINVAPSASYKVGKTPQVLSINNKVPAKKIEIKNGNKNNQSMVDSSSELAAAVQ